ncbi:uncharacterized CRM domain-containing protein At3g25440, chloroplastic-like isoform X2 [Phalaenopsis equestris]|uniref:uncharacterized CRM domain-containing protein At3g25440, chloroplastic-like isoform X2 n=1 Tax=Phalaenopsis equestris TaxID=78828 RepID=UPI0009E40CDF|nr:uncharacterized CRM domain-containing protein At3g25440, chloroplastic-like isoform X2 [Phalaenopsis equestris]
MAWRFLWFQLLRRTPSSLLLHSSRPTLSSIPPFSPRSDSFVFLNCSVFARGLSFGLVNLVLSDGKPKFEIHEMDPPKKEKWKSKKRLKMQRKREKRKRKEANRRDPRRIGPKGKKKQKFPTAEARIKYKIEKAKVKETLLVEKLKKYEVSQIQGPNPEENLTGEERFYIKKMAQKRSNYVPIGRRGIFGGVILNMHLHWKKHETVKVLCKPCKPGQVHEYAKELARLSGGVLIEIIGNDTIIFYRGKNYVQPEVMSPVDTLSKKRALEKSKYEQSLETVRRFIAIAEKELELYYRHIALYGNPNTRNADFVYDQERKRLPNTKNMVSRFVAEENAADCSKTFSEEPLDEISLNNEYFSADEAASDDYFIAGIEDDSDDENLTGTETDSDDELGEIKVLQ